MQPSFVTVVVGTRPEVIKMAPVVRALTRRPERFCVDLCVVAQQGEVLDRALAEWGLEPSIKVDINAFGRPLGATLGATLGAVEGYLLQRRPDFVLVHGDTSTTLGASLASFYAQVPFGHVEAGLRTGDRAQPFPEEMHRVVVDRLAAAHYAPTERAREALLSEGVSPASVRVVGNTVVDALRAMGARPTTDTPALREVLVTCHRRENFGAGARGVCEALRRLVLERDDVAVTYVLHPHPSAQEAPRAALGGLPRATLLDPMGHRDFVSRLAKAWLVVTDSGGVQEEAACLGRPILVARERTERVEAVRAGVARVVGTATRAVFDAVTTLLDSPAAYDEMRRPVDVFGDGRASERIADDLAARLGAPR